MAECKQFRALTGKIVEVFGTRKEFADALGITTGTLLKKLDGQNEWKRDEILTACDLLDIHGAQEIYDFFFAG